MAKTQVCDANGGTENALLRPLEQLAVPRRTFCRWYDRLSDGGPEALTDRPSTPSRVWNRIPSHIHDQIIELSLEQSELSPRELAVQFTDEALLRVRSHGLPSAEDK